MKSFAHNTTIKFGALLAAAAFTVSTPSYAAFLSKAQGLAISANIVAAEGTASSAAGPAAVVQLALAINTLGNAINTSVDDLSTVLSPAQAASIKGLVTAAHATATTAQAQPDPVGSQTLATAFKQLGDAMKQLISGSQKVVGQGGTTEIAGLIDNNVGLFIAGATSSVPQAQVMARATRGLADALGVMVNILTT